jgi:hypothetical protein
MGHEAEDYIVRAGNGLEGLNTKGRIDKNVGGAVPNGTRDSPDSVSRHLRAGLSHSAPAALLFR